MTSNHFKTILGAFTPPTNNQRRLSFESSDFGSKESRLRVGFRPCIYSVVCGRGKHSFNHVGNRRFRTLAKIFVERYSQADTKGAKSAIVSEIIVVIRQAGGHFCKFKSGAWFDVGDPYAREKVGALLRDLLYTQYRSSAKAKIGRRLQTMKQQPNQSTQSCQNQVEGIGDSDDSSTTSSCWGKSKNSLGFEYWLEESDDFFDIDVF
jgi:hypothetical protein